MSGRSQIALVKVIDCDAACPRVQIVIEKVKLQGICILVLRHSVIKFSELPI